MHSNLNLRSKIKTIAAFDFDRTITKSDSFNDLIISRFGYASFLFSLIKFSPLIFLYIIGVSSNEIIKQKLFAHFFHGMSVEEFLEITQEYSSGRLEKIIRPEALSKITWHKNKGHILVIVSAAPEQWISPWAKRYDFNHIITTKLEIKDGLLTGYFSTPNCFGKEKVRRFLEVFPLRDTYQLYVYGNGKGDEELLRLADKAYKNMLAPSFYAIVTDGLWRKSLATVRALGKSNFHVSVMGDSLATMSFWSSYTRRRILKPTAQENPTAFGRALVALLKTYDRNNKPILFPMEDASILWVSEHKSELQRLASFLVPPLRSLRISLDKALTLQIAEQLAIPCPRTFVAQTSSEFESLQSNLKMEHYVIKPLTGSGSAGIIYGKYLNKKETESHWRAFGPLMIQERIPSQGRAMGVSLLFDSKKRCIASFAHERLQQYPNSGGPSTDRISVYAPELVKHSIRLLQALNWQGVAMAEWKEDPRDGRIKLLEINPRFWGSLELAIRSGVNFPLLYAKAATGDDLEPIMTYQTGVRCRWIVPGDILRYLTQSREKRESLMKFLSGLPQLAEEWCSTDLRGTAATIICQALLALNPKYWKYVKRNNQHK